jgi:hypothetical protein
LFSCLASAFYFLAALLICSIPRPHGYCM